MMNPACKADVERWIDGKKPSVNRLGELGVYFPTILKHVAFFQVEAEAPAIDSETLISKMAVLLSCIFFRFSCFSETSCLRA